MSLIFVKDSTFLADFLNKHKFYILIMSRLFCSSYNKALILFVYYNIASLSHYSYEIVVNLMEDLMLLFSFLISSSYFFKLFSRIFVDRFYPEGLNLSLVWLLNPGVLALMGYY